MFPVKMFPRSYISQESQVIRRQMMLEKVKALPTGQTLSKTAMMVFGLEDDTEQRQPQDTNSKKRRYSIENVFDKLLDVLEALPSQEL